MWLVPLNTVTAQAESLYSPEVSLARQKRGNAMRVRREAMAGVAGEHWS